MHSIRGLFDSLDIVDNVLKLDDIKCANNIMVYVSRDDEVDTIDLINRLLAMGKNVILPVVDKCTKTIVPVDYKSGAIIGLSLLDVIIVPCIAIDADGNRVGYGEGYFDRFITQLPKRISTIALAFDCQLVDHIDVESHDVPIDIVITETGVRKI
jgi:5-formyltetrahydrofolate cyclo-ligase